MSSPSHGARDVFNDALDKTPRARTRFLNDVCDGDATLRREVESLLAAWLDRNDFLEPGRTTGQQLGTIGRFELLEELGRGGQAVVYRALDTRSRLQVALKVLPLPLQRSPDAEIRFLREAESASRLDHPGLCRVFEGGDADGVLYMAMELVDGETLHAKLTAARDRGCADPLAVTLERFARIADSLHFAHEHGLVHRDVKPANVMIRPDGQPVVLDFGLVRDLDRSGAPMTNTAEVIGTPFYLAPEQLATERTTVDRRADVYALGVTLYECVTLERPFDAATRDGLYRRILSGDPPDPRRFARDVPRDLCTVLATAMETDPARRYATAADFAADLVRVREGRPIRAERANTLRRAALWIRRNPIVATAAASLFVAISCALVVALSILADVATERDRARVEALVRASAEVSRTDPELGLLLAREAASRELNVATASQLHQALASIHQRAILSPHDAKLRFAKFSPDGSTIATQTTDAVRLWTPDGNLTAIIDAPRAGRAVFDPLARFVAIPCADNIVRLVGLDGTLRKALLGHKDHVTCAAVSPDGTLVVAGSRDGSLRTWNPLSGESSLLGQHDGAIRCVAIGPNGEVLSGSTDTTVRIWQPDSGTERVMRGHQRAVLQIEVSSHGVVASRTSRAVQIWRDDGVVVLPPAPDFVNAIEFSPDGELLLTACSDHTIGLWSTRGDLVTRIRGHEAPVESATFSPRGDRVLSGSADLTARVWDLDGDLAVVLRGHESAVMAVGFSPDGRTLLSGSADRTARTWSLDPPGLPVLRGHDLGLYDARPLGRGDLYVTASRDRTSRVWRADGALVAELRGHEGLVFSASVIDDGNGVMTTGYDRTARFWNLDGEEFARSTSTSGRFFGTVDPTSQGRMLTRSRGHSVRIVDRAGQDLATLTGHSGMIWWAEFSPLGNLVATASADGTARIWNTHGECLATLAGHDDRVRCASFSPNGDHIVTTSDDGSARVWTLDGKPRATLLGHQAEVLQAEFANDGQRIVTASRDKTARLWQLSGQPILTLRGHAGVVWSARFTADGTGVITASSDRTARFWLADPQALLRAASRQARPFTSHERRRFAELLGPSVATEAK